MAASATNLIWIDLEMTGLEVDSERIIEIATIVTDSDLNIIAEGPEIVINQPQEYLDAMDDWNTKQHGKSGLIAKVQQSMITEVQAEQRTIAFLAEHVTKGASPMCGNTICQDRRFLHRYMPELESFFHYRHIDVSTLKELAKRWRPRVYNGVAKQDGHRALADIKDSIAELVYYREHFLNLERVSRKTYE